ncbi:lactosylceramide 4-alpha-galactosyltransferase [Ranunculus cassubicifolius]
MSNTLLQDGIFSISSLPTSHIFQHSPTRFRRMDQIKASLFSTISFAACLIVILLLTSILCNYSLQTAVLLDNTSEQLQILSPSKVHRRLQLDSVQEEFSITGGNPRLPPVNVSEDERIAWFRKELPEIKIFKSTESTRKFKERAERFFQRGCDIQFFMTWISPVKKFGERELFSVESVFKSHPYGCLMILSQTMDSKQGNEIFKPLIQKGCKLLAVAPDLPFLFKNTPAETWFEEMKKGNKDPGEIPLAQNLSNLLRLAVLYRYGGVYLDTDFVVIKKLSGLRNTIGAQSMDADSGNWSRLNNAVLIFDKKHPLIYKFIEEFALTFDGNKWGHNGPYLVSRVLERVKNRPGFEVTVLPPLAFYPLSWSKIGGIFQKPTNRHQSRWVAAKLKQMSVETYGVHLWNKQSNRMRIEDGSIMSYLISRNCILCAQSYSSR